MYLKKEFLQIFVEVTDPSVLFFFSLSKNKSYMKLSFLDPTSSTRIVQIHLLLLTRERALI